MVRRRSTEGLSGMLAIVSLVCGSLWMLYGIVVNNPFIYVPNVLGVVFSLVQVSRASSFLGGFTVPTAATVVL